MKKLFANPAFALLLTVVVVLATMLISTRVGFGKKCSVLTDGFYSRNDGETPIAVSLRALCSASEQIAQLGLPHDAEVADDLMETSDGLREMLRSPSVSLRTVNSLYDSLLSELFAMETLLGRVELSESELAVFAEARRSAAEAKAAIDASAFNVEVYQFLKRYDRFPTAALASLTGVAMPCAFS